MAAGAGAAARRHRVRAGPGSRCSCAADGGTVAECSPFLCVCRLLPSRLSTLYFLKQRIPEQIVDTPVPHGGRGASGALQGFLPERSSLKRTANKIADIPAPRSSVRRLQGFLPEQSATAFGEADHRFPAASVEHIVDNPVSGESLQDLRPGQSSASSSHSPADFADDAFNGFSHFSPGKKTRHYLRTRAYGRRLLVTSPWCSRRRMSPRTSLTLTSSTWSLTCAGGGASGSRLASSIAGGWPRQMAAPMAHRQRAMVIGDWFDSGYMVCVSSWVLVPYCTSFLREDELGSCGRLCLAPWCVGL